MGKSKNEFKNWLSIQRVKLGLFMKNHKYLSATVGLFLITIIIAVIVFASDSDPFENTITVHYNRDTRPLVVSSTESNEERIVKSFSTVIYDIPYNLSSTVEGSTENINRMVKIDVKLPKTVDASVFTLNNDSMNVDTTTDSENDIYTFYDYKPLGGEVSTSVYLNVYNLPKDSVVSPIIKICESTTASDDASKCAELSGEDTKITIDAEKINLVTKTIAGSPYNSQEERYIPFGILVGISEDDLTDGKLVGKFFDKDVRLFLQAKQATSSSESVVMSQKIADNYYGLYKGSDLEGVKISIPGKDAFPYSSKNISQNNSLFNSGTVTYALCETEECNVYGNANTYVLNISNIKTNGEYLKFNGKGYTQDFGLVDANDSVLTNMKQKLGVIEDDAKNNKFLAIGSYYITGIYNNEYKNLNSDVWVSLSSKYNNGTNVVDGMSYFTIDAVEKQIHPEHTTTFEVDSSSNDKSTVAYGETVILRSVTKYNVFNSSDISSEKYSIVGTIPVDSITGNPSFNMVEYDENITDAPSPYHLSVGGSTEDLEQYGLKVTYCSTDPCGDGIDYEQYVNSLNTDSPIKLLYLKYELTNVPASKDVDFRIRLYATTSNYGDAEAETSITINDTIEVESSTNVTVTPFKSRIGINIDGKGNDARVNISEKASSTITIYPSIYLPANNIQTNAVPINNNKTQIDVILPEGIKYISNNDYIKPKVVDANGKTLTYELSNLEINSWVDPIHIDVAYDISVKSNEPYVVEAKIQSTATGDVGVQLSDISSEDARTAKASITFINAKPISYSLNSNINSIGKDQSFDITASIYNRQSSEANGLELIYILPNNDGTTSSFSGDYLLDFSSEDQTVMCTTRSYVEINNPQNLLNNDNNIWEECNADDNYTAIKVSGITLASQELYSNTISISPEGSSYGDHYLIQAYVINNNDIIATLSTGVSVESFKITGNVWEDFDGNGIYDDGESKIPDVELQLYDASTNELIKTVYSKSDGTYTFDQISPEETSDLNFYIVANYNNAKYSPTKKAVGNDKSLYSSFEMIGNDDEECVSIENQDDEDLNEDSDENSDEEPDEELDDNDEEDLPILAPDSTCQIVTRTDSYTIPSNIHVMSDINLGLTPRKEYSIKLNKYISSATVTNVLGVSNTTEYGKVSFAKLDIKDIGNVNIKVTYSIEIKNTGFYPGYIYKVKDLIPDGMTFNENYAENKDWALSDSGYLENVSLSALPILSGETKYLTLSLDLTRKEAGSFINNAIIEDTDLMIYSGTASDLKNGGASNE